jgi:hypothetical protein
VEKKENKSKQNRLGVLLVLNVWPIQKEICSASQTSLRQRWKKKTLM